mmetsp:Transcript_11698/g.25093  ORF Transcript_11698/g.25093 Transcript_11698/m.25093 type:complete len:264 (+) Transcript_11698:3277-4068(+)
MSTLFFWEPMAMFSPSGPLECCHTQRSAQACALFCRPMSQLRGAVECMLRYWLCLLIMKSTSIWLGSLLMGAVFGGGGGRVLPGGGGGRAVIPAGGGGGREAPAGGGGGRAEVGMVRGGGGGEVARVVDGGGGGEMPLGGGGGRRLYMVGGGTVFSPVDGGGGGEMYCHCCQGGGAGFRPWGGGGGISPTEITATSAETILSDPDAAAAATVDEGLVGRLAATLFEALSARARGRPLSLRESVSCDACAAEAAGKHFAGPIIA